VSQTNPDGDRSPGRLLNVLGLAFGLAGSVGGTIGAGILRTPGLVAAQLPSGSWIVAIWLLGGIYALLGASCLAELGAWLPRAGGWYVYAEAAFGQRVARLVGCCDWLAHCIGLGWVATTLGDLLAKPLGCNSSIPAIAVLLLFALVQWWGVRAGGASQELLSFGKALAFLVLVGACFLLPHPIAMANTPPPLASGSPGLLPIVVALQAVITTYDGWASPVYFAEEFNNPSQDLPRSLIGGVIAVMGLYLLINAALLHVLPVADLAEAKLPAAAAAALVLGPQGSSLITAVALLALLGLINTVVMAAPRILFGLSRDGYLPGFVQSVNPGGTPTTALALTVAFSVVLVLAGSFEQLLGIGAFLYVGLPLVGVVALFRLRLMQPDQPRPYSCWGYPLTPLLVGAISVGFLGGSLLSDTRNALWALGLMAATGLLAELSTQLSLQPLPASSRPDAESRDLPDCQGR